MTGMGVVKVGPAVHGSRSPVKSAVPAFQPVPQNSSHDPFSLSFQPPMLYTADKSPEKVLSSVFSAGNELIPAPRSPTKQGGSRSPLRLGSASRDYGQVSPDRKRWLSPTKYQPAQSSHQRLRQNENDHAPHPPQYIVERQPDPMDIDSLPILVSSPFSRASSPRKLLGSDGLSRKHGANSDSSEDEIDFLSPRKKPRAVSPVRGASPAPLNLIRSPPRKPTPRLSPTKVGAVGGPSSVPMQRSSAMQLSPAFLQASALGASSSTAASPQRSAPPFIHPDHFRMPSHAHASPANLGLESNYSPGQASPMARSSPARRRLPTTGSYPTLPDLPRYEEQPSVRSGAPARPFEAILTQMDEDETIVPRPDRSFVTACQDTSIASVSAADVSSSSSMSSSSETSSANQSMSSATTQGLTHLRNMLSRLQMPRQSLGGRSSLGSMSSTSSRSSIVNTAKTANPAGSASAAVSGSTSRLATTIRNGRASGPQVALPSSNARTPQLASSSTIPAKRQATSGSTSRSISSSQPLSTSSTSATHGAPSNTAARLAARRQTAVLPTSQSTATIAAVTEPTPAGPSRNLFLKGVVAYVDVRTGEGDDAGMIFVDMLKSMGARVTTRPTLTLTHIVYKSGRPATLQRYRSHPDPKPHLVGIGWVVRCTELGRRVDEKQFLVDVSTSVFSTSGVTGSGLGAQQKRRKSMEPKALRALGEGSSGANAVEPDSRVQASIAASIERARRKSLQYAPKVGSPLAKRVYSIPIEQVLHQSNEDDEDE